MRRLSPRRGRRTRGLTLIELMVAIAVVAVLMAAAVPYLGDYVVNSRLREAGNLVFTEALMAQSEAIKRNTTIQLSTNGSQVQVIEMADDDTTTVLRERTLPGNVTAPTQTFDFGPEGRPVPFGTSLTMNLSASGVTCSDDLRCPGLRVDGGGAIRLCGNHLNCT